MSGYRFMFDLFIPFEKDTKDIPADLKKDILIIREQMVKLKEYAQKITPTDSTGNRMTEETDKATFHVCHHDENPVKPCGEEKDVSLLTDEKPVISSILDS